MPGVRLEWMLMLELLDETHKDAESFPYRQTAYPENNGDGITVAVIKIDGDSDTLSLRLWHSR